VGCFHIWKSFTMDGFGDRRKSGHVRSGERPPRRTARTGGRGQAGRRIGSIDGQTGHTARAQNGTSRHGHGSARARFGTCACRAVPDVLPCQPPSTSTTRLDLERAARQHASTSTPTRARERHGRVTGRNGRRRSLGEGIQRLPCLERADGAGRGRASRWSGPCPCRAVVCGFQHGHGHGGMPCQHGHEAGRAGPFSDRAFSYRARAGRLIGPFGHL